MPLWKTSSPSEAQLNLEAQINNLETIRSFKSANIFSTLRSMILLFKEKEKKQQFYGPHH